MNFSEWLNESSLNDLYTSTVKAYPATTLRQHAIDPIRIAKLSIVPLKGMKSVYFSGLAQNENREYSPIILFKEVKFDHVNSIHVNADDGYTYHFKQLSPRENNIVVKCNCKDFYWRFNHYNYLDHSLYGRDRKAYEGKYAINPKEMPGMCKHLIALAKSLRDSEILIS